MKRNKRVLFVQFTNPAGYPPLQHAAGMLLESGFDVRFLGTDSYGSKQLRFPDTIESITYRQGFVKPGWRQKLAFMWYQFRVFWSLLSWRPDWVYGSDPMSAISLALARKLGFKTIYHEHDTPDASVETSAFQFRILQNRAQALGLSTLVVFPNAKRAEFSAKQISLKHFGDRLHIVWNCPSKMELDWIQDQVKRSQNNRLNTPDRRIRLYFHGSIVRERLPSSLIEAMAHHRECVTLDIFGYFTEARFEQELADQINALDLSGNITIHKPLATRLELLQGAVGYDFGIAFYSASCDINHQTMAGASNKVFDYVASGMKVMIDETPEWRGLFKGMEHLVVFVRDHSVESMTVALNSLIDEGNGQVSSPLPRKFISREDWTYESQFMPVLGQLRTH